MDDFIQKEKEFLETKGIELTNLHFESGRFTFTIDYYVIDFEVEEDKFQFLSVKHMNSFSLIENDKQKEILSFLIRVAEQKKVTLLFIPSSIIPTQQSMNVMAEVGFIPQGGYSKLDSFHLMNTSLERCKSFTGKTGFSFVYEIKKDHLFRIKQFRKDFLRLQKNIEKSYPLCIMDKFKSFRLSLGYYYEGHESIISFYFSDGDIIIHDRSLDLEHIYSDFVSLQEFFHQLFGKIKTNQRLRNVFNPPKRHFRDTISQCGFMISSDELFKELCTYIKAEEIERRCASEAIQEIIKSVFLNHLNSFRFVKIFHVYMVITPGDNRNHFRLFLEKDTASSYLEEQLQKHASQTIDKIKKEPI